MNDRFLFELCWLWRLVRTKDHIFPVATQSEGVVDGFVQRALPQLAIGVSLPAQTLGVQSRAVEVEDADLLAGEGVEDGLTAGYDKPAVVGSQQWLDAEVLLIARLQRDSA